MNGTYNYAMIVAVAVSVAVTGYMVMDVSMAASEGYYENAEQWCDERGGMLYNAQALWHGGLHCKLQNGTHVHMSDVVDTG